MNKIQLELFPHGQQETETNLAKLQAIRETFLIFVAFDWGYSFKLEIKSDSLNAVSWIKNPKGAPCRVQKWLLHVETFNTEIGKSEFRG